MKIKELLTDETKWTQFAVARDALGGRVHANDPTACKWCLLGAIAHCYPGSFVGDKVRSTIEYHVLNISIWNDAHWRTFQDVKELIERLDI